MFEGTKLGSSGRSKPSSNDGRNCNANHEKELVKVHEGKKPFKHKSCDSSCDLKGDLQKHIASIHEVHDRKKPYICEFCYNMLLQYMRGRSHTNVNFVTMAVFEKIICYNMLLQYTREKAIQM